MDGTQKGKHPSAAYEFLYQQSLKYSLLLYKQLRKIYSPDASVHTYLYLFLENCNIAAVITRTVIEAITRDVIDHIHCIKLLYHECPHGIYIPSGRHRTTELLQCNGHIFHRESIPDSMVTGKMHSTPEMTSAVNCVFATVDINNPIASDIMIYCTDTHTVLRAVTENGFQEEYS